MILTNSSVKVLLLDTKYREHRIYVLSHMIGLSLSNLCSCIIAPVVFNLSTTREIRQFAAGA